MRTKPPSTHARSEYLIDRHLVVFESGVGQCACEEFRATQECRHTRESEGRRAAQELIAERVRSVGGTLVPFGHRKPAHDPVAGKRERTFAITPLSRMRTIKKHSPNR